MESKQNQCLTLSCSSVMYLALESQADQREKDPARSAVPRTRPCLAVRGDPFTTRPRAQGEADSKPVVQEFLLDSWIYEWEHWVPPWLLCEACWALPVVVWCRLHSRSPPAPWASQWVFQRSEIRQVKILMDE